MQRKGFSLVELSIVLVILGLLTGGILAGQSLIRAAELRSIPTQLQTYQTAARAFQDKYFTWPGDLGNATSFWGKNSADCNGNTGVAATPGTCNGNADGMLSSPVAANVTGETFQFWKQLALAGLIEGTYTGLAGGGGERGAWPGTNVPRGKPGNSGISIEDYSSFVGDLYRWDGNYSKTFYFGQPGNGTTLVTTQHPTEFPALKAEDAWNLDTKIDDGRPGYGIVRSHKTTVSPLCTTTNVQATALYNLSESSPNICGFLYTIAR